MSAEEMIEKSFNCVDSYSADPDLGFKILPITGDFIRSVDLDEFISRIKAMLPSDVKLIRYMGGPLRESMDRDEYGLVFGSKTWPRGPEGGILPRLEPLFLGEAVGAIVPDLRIIHVPEGIECRVVFNKQAHMLVVPKEEETEQCCIVVVRPNKK